MDVTYPRCAGLDVHASSITACLRIAAGQEDRRVARVGHVARGGRLYARSDGGHRRVMEAGLAHPGRAIHARHRERPAHSQRAGAEE
jgi:hypothetical protein